MFLLTFYVFLVAFFGFTFVVTFEQGSSRGAASGGSDLLKNGASLRILSILAKLFVPFKQGPSRGAASGVSDF